MADRRRARKTTTGKRRKKSGGLWRRLLQFAALLALVAIGYAAWFWYDMQSWRPDEATYPEQGAVIPSGSGPVRFETLKAIGADFVYLELGAIGAAPDPGFRERFAAARKAGLKVGVVQPFNPCTRADPQSARYTRMVPRDADLLPPALSLMAAGTHCDPQVSEAAVTSEVLTLVNQIEAHAGKPAILKLGEAFEDRFAMAQVIERDLWLIRDRSRPRYASRPWLLWSANSQLSSEAMAQPVEWVVVQR
ncbi:MAG: glycoside hydrolase family 25 protein [Pseudomonadota bacterium]|nr:glycoside hydrolase family 25 protein [Pseudomonadota bacterium]